MLFKLFVAVVKIFVADIDDTPPEFFDLNKNFEIFEFDSSDENNEFQSYNITPRISVIDQDSSSNNFEFNLEPLNETPEDLIQIIQNKNNEVILNVQKIIDREDPKLIEFGILKFRISVIDDGGNSESAEVSDSI